MPNSDAEGGAVVGGSDLPSCDSCRKRKLKCSRAKPACSNCERYDTPCSYDTTRNKPGLKTGAIEGLNKRIETDDDEEALERRLDSLPPGSEEHRRPASPNASEPILGVLSSLAKEIKHLNSNLTQNHSDTDGNDGPIPKRRRVERNEASWQQPDPRLVSNGDKSLFLPEDKVLGKALDAYFARVHPWNPILQEAAFRRKCRTYEGKVEHAVILHAMFYIGSRFIELQDSGYGESFNLQSWREKSRDFILRNAMADLSVPNLQSLAILAFGHIGDGDTFKAWPLIGSLARSVEYLQLSVEEDDRKARSSSVRPPQTLKPPVNWVEEEERRRVFWCIFLLDRYCSITTGWNTSLTAADVSRRLPACGGLWYYQQTPVDTPYFGIWQDSAADLGQSIAFLPSHKSKGSGSKVAADAPVGSERPTSRRVGSQASPSGSDPNVDMSNVGAFAYLIESTESLNRVITFFLRQSIDFQSREETSNWLIRFKELDLRLIHWKFFLPQQWKGSGYFKGPALGMMDPNMTLAYAIHNISTILLHHKIAYPTPELRGVNLPSAYSADTCSGAAMQTAKITTQYLEHDTKKSPVAPQMGFCAFISARTFLVHSRVYGDPLSSGFWTLINNLETMSQRWLNCDNNYEPKASSSIFGQYALRLRALHQRFLADPTSIIDVLGVSEDSAWESELTETAPDGASGCEQQTAEGHTAFTDPLTVSPVPLELLIPDFQVTTTGLPSRMTQAIDGSGPQTDEPPSMSEMFSDPSFSNIDRFISAEDMFSSFHEGPVER